MEQDEYEDALDERYEEMQRAIEEVEKKKKNMNYRNAHVACCFTCKHSKRVSNDDGLQCLLLWNEQWAVNYVHDAAICNEYEP